EMGNALDRRRAGADDADDLVLQAGQAAGRIAARIVVIPPARVEHVTLEAVDAGNPGELRPRDRGEVAQYDEPRPHGIAAIGANDPAAVGFIPAQLGHPGLEADVAVEIELAGDALAMLAYLMPFGEASARHEAGLFEQRQ